VCVCLLIVFSALDLNQSEENEATADTHMVGSRRSTLLYGDRNEHEMIEGRPVYESTKVSEALADAKFCSECGAESAPAGQRLPAAGGDRAWAARTGSGPMWMCGDIFAAARLWRGRLLTTGRLSCRHPVVV